MRSATRRCWAPSCRSAFDLRALEVGGLGDAATRLVKFGHRVPEVGDQPLMAPVCEHHAADPVQQLAIAEQGDVMDERGLVAAVTGVDGRDGAVEDRLLLPLDRMTARSPPAVHARSDTWHTARVVATPRPSARCSSPARPR
jgi:hypothetical protein